MFFTSKDQIHMRLHFNCGMFILLWSFFFLICYSQIWFCFTFAVLSVILTVFQSQFENKLAKLCLKAFLILDQILFKKDNLTQKHNKWYSYGSDVMGNQSFSKWHEVKNKPEKVTMNIYPSSPDLWERKKIENFFSTSKVLNKETESGPSKLKKKEVRSWLFTVGILIAKAGETSMNGTSSTETAKCLHEIRPMKWFGVMLLPSHISVVLNIIHIYLIITFFNITRMTDIWTKWQRALFFTPFKYSQ